MSDTSISTLLNKLEKEIRSNTGFSYTLDAVSEYYNGIKKSKLTADDYKIQIFLSLLRNNYTDIINRKGLLSVILNFNFRIN